VTIPKQSSIRVLARRAVLKVVINASFVLEPLRLRVRRNALDRACATSPLADHEFDSCPPILLLAVYRAKNARFVEALLRQVHPDADVRLWALDQIAPELVSSTFGCGPGLRFVHLNWLYNVKPVAADAWLVLADDDVLFAKGSLVKTVRLMGQAGFSFAQPGQSIFGWWTSLFNVARPLVVARDTNYVEQGPLVIADPSFAKQILPLPEENDMGWGIEAEWYRKKEGHFRIGVIDDCRIVHWNQNATSYAAAPEIEKMMQRLANSGVDSLWQLQSVNGYWWKWQRRPAWRKRRLQ